MDAFVPMDPAVPCVFLVIGPTGLEPCGTPVPTLLPDGGINRVPVCDGHADAAQEAVEVARDAVRVPGD